MSAVIARSAVAPLFAAASLRTEQVSQLVLGETAEVLETSGTWHRVRTTTDGYEGWIHAGYLLEVDDAAAARWRASARASGAPGQECPPRPNAMCLRAFGRSTSKVSGFSN